MGALPDTADPVGALLLLLATVCILAASLTICYAIWSRGWEGWEAWNERTGLNESEALATRQQRIQDERHERSSAR